MTYDSFFSQKFTVVIQSIDLILMICSIMQIHLFTPTILIFKDIDQYHNTVNRNAYTLFDCWIRSDEVV